MVRFIDSTGEVVKIWGNVLLIINEIQNSAIQEERQAVFKELMENNCQLIILYPEKMFQKPTLNKDWSV